MGIPKNLSIKILDPPSLDQYNIPKSLNIYTGMIMPKEAKARILINDLLLRVGWRFFDDENSPANITLETHVKVKGLSKSKFKDSSF